MTGKNLFFQRKKKNSIVIEEESSLCLAYQESMNNTIYTNIGYDFVMEGDFFGLNYEVCNVVFEGKAHKKLRWGFWG